MKRLSIAVLVILCALIVAFLAISFGTTNSRGEVELLWSQRFDRQELALKTIEIPPAMAQQFAQIGEYRLSSSVTINDSYSVRKFRLVFDDSMTSDEHKALFPKLSKIFSKAPYQVNIYTGYRNSSLSFFDFIRIRIRSDGAKMTIRFNEEHSPAAKLSEGK